jgi:hypothetical protein
MSSIFSKVTGAISKAFHYLFSPSTEAEIMKIEAEAVSYLPQAMSIAGEAAALFGPSPMISELLAAGAKLQNHITVAGDPNTPASPAQLAAVLQAVAVEGLNKLLPNASPGAVQKAASEAVAAIHAISNT